MISKKTKALEGIYRLSDYLDKRLGEKTKEETAAVNAVIDYITTLSDLTWIPISKAVPNEEGEYLTTTFHGSVYCDHWNGEYFERTETVIAWMKKPEPYMWRNDDE